MIPIYRAKKIDSDKYVDGYYFHQEWTGDYPNEDAEEREEEIKHFICGFTTHDILDDEEGYFKFMGLNEIDSATLSIHFPSMLDSQGNKIFASLREDGKGGDKFIWDSETFIVWFDNQALRVNATNKDNFECNCYDSLQEWFDYKSNLYDLEVIGIQE